MDRLAVIVLGTRKSGKSTTWNVLFRRTVHTGKHQRFLRVASETLTSVFLVSGSAEEREEYVGSIVADKTARIVLCSVQYTSEARRTFEYFRDNGFRLVVQWLNPGYHDLGMYLDHLGLGAELLHGRAVLSLRDGKADPGLRTEELREYVLGWAVARGLTYPEEAQ